MLAEMCPRVPVNKPVLQQSYPGWDGAHREGSTRSMYCPEGLHSVDECKPGQEQGEEFIAMVNTVVWSTGTRARGCNGNSVGIIITGLT